MFTARIDLTMRSEEAMFRTELSTTVELGEAFTSNSLQKNLARSAQQLCRNHGFASGMADAEITYEKDGEWYGSDSDGVFCFDINRAWFDVDGCGHIPTRRIRKIEMQAAFQLLERKDGVYVPCSTQISCVSPGAYWLKKEGRIIGIDFDTAEGGVVQRGEDFLYYEHCSYGNTELDDSGISKDFTAILEANGLNRKYITAEYLASVDTIDEFFVNFLNEKSEECEIYNNADPDDHYRLRLLYIGFVDIASHKTRYIKQSVIDAFNNEKLAG